MTERQSYDTLVVGGGVAGSACACVIARSGGSVLLLDQPRVRVDLGESLPPPANTILDELGLAEEFSRAGHVQSYGTTSSWGEEQPRDREFIHDTHGPGWHLDMERFVEQLQTAARLANCKVMSGSLSSIARTRSGWSVEADTPTGRLEVRAATLIDATGRKRRITRQLETGWESYDRLVAVVAKLRPRAGSPLEHRTFVEAAQWGWWYTNPLPAGGVAVGFVTDGDIVRGLGLYRSQNWYDLLSMTTGMRDRFYVESHGRSEPTVVAAHSGRLKSVAGDGWFAVGDAAGTHDPLSAQGITSALLAARELSKIVTGNGRAAELYSAWFGEQCAAYLAQWISYYDIERRWPKSTFWSRRHDIARSIRRGPYM